MTPAHVPAERLDGAQEPCPTPLNWQEVLTSFEESADGGIYGIGDAEITVREFGQGSPLFLLPGLGGSPRLFALTAWVLRDQYRCLLIDHPVWTKSPRIRDLIPATAEIWAEILRLQAPQGADLYAPSFGGQIALELLARHPGSVNRCLLQGAWATRRMTLAEKTVLQVGRGFPWPLRRVPLWLSTQIQNHRRWFPPFDESRFGFLLHESASIRANVLAARLRAAATTDLTPALPTIAAPIRLLRTEGEGPPIAAAMEHLERHLPHADVEWMPLCGQYPYLTHPHRLVKIIRQFFPTAPPST